MAWSKRMRGIATAMVTVFFIGTQISNVQDAGQTTPTNTVETPKPAESSVRNKLEGKFGASRSRVKRRQIVKQYAYWYAVEHLGLSPEEFWMVHEIWERESHWNWDALGLKQSDGRAKGIPQVKWSKMIKSPFRQVEKGFDYILARYGTVEAAYKFHMKNGWY